MDYVPLHLDDMDLVFTENNVATRNTTVVELIKSIPEGVQLTVPLILVATTVDVFQQLTTLRMCLGSLELCQNFSSGNTGQLLLEAINKFAACPTSVFFNSSHITKKQI